MYRVFCVLRYTWKYLGTVEATNIEEAIISAHTQYCGMELRIFNQNGEIVGRYE